MLVAGETPQENFRNLHAAGCIQTLCDLPIEEAEKKGRKIFDFLYLKTWGNPCKDCARLWNDGQCPANKEFDTGKINKRKINEARIKAATTANNGPFGEKSVRTIASMCGLSINEVRRKKVRGGLQELFDKRGELAMSVKS
jgi:hypothetical protein